MLLANLPKDSAVARIELGEQVDWGLAEQIQASIFDALQWANYQRGAGGGPKPKPMQRPGVKKSGRTIGPSGLDPEQTRAFLDQFKPPPADDQGGVSGD